MKKTQTKETRQVSDFGPLLHDFRSEYSVSAFRKYDGTPAIVGKYGRIIQMDDGVFDCWFIGRDKTPLSNQRMAQIGKNLPEGWHLHVLNGEAWVQGRGRTFVLAVAPLLSVRKRRTHVEAKTHYRLQAKAA